MSWTQAVVGEAMKGKYTEITVNWLKIRHVAAPQEIGHLSRWPGTLWPSWLFMVRWREESGGKLGSLSHAQYAHKERVILHLQRCIPCGPALESHGILMAELKIKTEKILNPYVFSQHSTALVFPLFWSSQWELAWAIIKRLGFGVRPGINSQFQDL